MHLSQNANNFVNVDLNLKPNLTDMTGVMHFYSTHNMTLEPKINIARLKTYWQVFPAEKKYIIMKLHQKLRKGIPCQ